MAVTRQPNFNGNGGALRELRVRAGLTQAQAAKRIGVAPEVISRWESGQYLPRFSNFRLLREVYGVPLEVLVRALTPARRRKPRRKP